jgi:hypothetical protein
MGESRPVVRFRLDKKKSLIMKVAARVLHKQSQTADKGWVSSRGFGMGTKFPTVLQFGVERT